jgi:hypothetical protein
VRITTEVSGDFKSTDGFLQGLLKFNLAANLEKYAQMGVDALSSATPIDSGVSAASWDYEVRSSKGSATIIWTNSNVVGGTPLVIMLQYGHGTGTGGYVQGRDFINPAMKPVFDSIADKVWKQVTNL